MSATQVVGPDCPHVRRTRLLTSLHGKHAPRCVRPGRYSKRVACPRRDVDQEAARICTCKSTMLERNRDTFTWKTRLKRRSTINSKEINAMEFCRANNRREMMRQVDAVRTRASVNNLSEFLLQEGIK